MPLKAKQEHVRITILRYLNETESGFANASLLTQVLRDDACLDVDRAFVVRELHWLENKGLLTTRHHEHLDILGVTITDTGEEVATRQKTVPGVRPPRRRS